jgi:hypothetical protein
MMSVHLAQVTQNYKLTVVARLPVSLAGFITGGMEVMFSVVAD